MPVLALQMFVYVVALIGATIYFAGCWVSAGQLSVRNQGIAIGLLVSPLGFGLPYAVLAVVGWLLEGSQSPIIVSDRHPLLSIPVALLFLLGPLVGPPATAGLVTAWYIRRRRA